MDSANLRQLLYRNKQYIPGGVNSPVLFLPYSSVMVFRLSLPKARGSKPTDIDGNEYIDYVLSYGPILGMHTVVTEAIQTAAAKGSSYGALRLAEIESLKFLCTLVPSWKWYVWSTAEQKLP